MAINTLATATIFQTTLDQIAVQEAKTGWMDANSGQVVYNGGAEVKVPKISLDGLADYDRDNGYTQGSVTLEYETLKMTQDRGRKFQLDAMDVNENNFVTTAATTMGEFQRIHVIPEIDAYRLSKLGTMAITKGNVEYGYTPAKGTMLQKIKKARAALRKKGFVGQIMIHITSDALMELELELAAQLRAATFKQGGIDTTVPAIDTDTLLIETADDRMHTAITMYDGKTSTQEKGGFVPAGKQMNFIAIGRTVPIAVTKQDKMKIFTPDQNQDADAWKMNYRRFHDVWTMDNKQEFVYANVKDEE